MQIEFRLPLEEVAVSAAGEGIERQPDLFFVKRMHSLIKSNDCNPGR